MSAGDSHSLKTLRTMQRQLSNEIDRLRASRGETDREIGRLMTQRIDIDGQIAALSRKPTVSEHALLRYCERVAGVDLDAAAGAILSPKIVEIIETIGSGEVPIGDGHVAVVKDKTVVTIK